MGLEYAKPVGMKTYLTSMLILAGSLCWNISTRAADLDFGDHSSQAITGKAWGSLAANKYDDTIAYTKKCIELFEKEELKMQAGLTEPVPEGDEKAISAKWALNDVGTCYFIQGKAYEGLEKNKEAMAAYKTLVTKLTFAQCWDPNGWFWKPADAAKERLAELEFDAEE
jgi:hypothetical protein